MSGTAVAKPKATVKDLLERAKPAFEAVLPKHLNAERMVKLVLLATTKTPKLLECDPKTLLSAVMQAAQLGLEINSALGSAYLVPFGNQVQLIPGYRGLIDLARRSGNILFIEARVAYKDEVFLVEQGTAPGISHRPSLGEKKDDEIVAVYAVALVKGAPRPQFEVMSREQVDAVRARSRAAKDGPWVTDFPEMARKTVVKRLCKYLPLSPELAAAIELDTRAETGEVGSISEVIDSDESLNQTVADRTREKAEDLKAKLAEHPQDEGEQSAGAGEAPSPAPSGDDPPPPPDSVVAEPKKPKDVSKPMF